MTKQIYPCLWFVNQAQEAAKYYCSIFKNSKLISESPIVSIFEINGSKFMSLNTNSNLNFNESVSFVIDCENQEEIDYYWKKLTENGGKEGQCGWCKDKYGVSWQVVPTVLGKLMNDPSRSQRVVNAFLKMKKFDIATLENA
jgi:predicted 3-demethylubiquinone-9 3-methyltransferase (glyoxalase superfamily)